MIRRGSTTALIVVLLSALGMGLTFKPAVRENVIPKNFGVVEEGRVYRAGQVSPAAMRRLHERFGFRTVIDLGSFERESRGERRNQRIAESLGVTRYRFDLIGDATGNPNAYVQALRIMTDPANQPVLVHCGAGSERTGCAVLLFENLMHGVSLEEGLKGAERFKHRPHRNPRLREVVEQYGVAIIESYRNGMPIAGVDPLPDPVATIAPAGK
jgi:tyrosine-protein phosphatase SIW14